MSFLDLAKKSFELLFDGLVLLFVFYALWWVISNFVSQAYAFYFQAVIVVLAFAALAYSIRATLGMKRKAKYRFRSYSELHSLTPYEFEHMIADLLRKMGYNTEVTPKSDGEEGGDYGADLIARKDGNTFVVEVKKWGYGHLVGADVIRSALGAMPRFRANKAIIITSSGFTNQAMEQAKGAPVELWDGKHLKKMVEKYRPYS